MGPMYYFREGYIMICWDEKYWVEWHVHSLCSNIKKEVAEWPEYKDFSARKWIGEQVEIF